jgi:hypothetical protein
MCLTKIIRENILAIYLKYLGCSNKPLFITTNDLASMSFCPNKAYLQVNFLAGVSEYKFRQLNQKMRKDVEKFFEKKTPWLLAKDELLHYFLHEMWSFSFIPEAFKFYPEEIRKATESIKIKVSLPKEEKSLIKRGIFHSMFRINFGFRKFFISGIPDVVIIKNGKISGVIEIKSTDKHSTIIFDSESDQADFYRYYVLNRKLPITQGTWFLTLKKQGKYNEVEEELLCLLQDCKRLEKDEIISIASNNGYLIKESSESLDKIENKITTRISLLLQEEPPLKICPWSSCSFRMFCKKLNVKQISL